MDTTIVSKKGQTSKLGTVRVGDQDEAGAIEAKTVANLELIGAFVEHLNLEMGIEIPEEYVLSFFNG